MLLHLSSFCQVKELGNLKRNFVKYFCISLALFGVGIFLGFAEKFGWVQGFNVATVKAAQSARNAFWTPYFMTVAKYAGTAYDIAIGLIVVVVLAMLKRWKEPLEIFLSLVFAGASVVIMKTLYKVPRPDFSQLIPESSFSYPSGHSVGAVALYGLLAYMIVKSKLPKTISWTLATLLSVFAASILYDRLYIGVHWGMDIIGGGIIGLACAILAVGIAQSWKSSKENDVNRR